MLGGKHELKQEIRRVFEPRYGKSLSNKEVNEIETNLIEFIKLIKESRLDEIN